MTDQHVSSPARRRLCRLAVSACVGAGLLAGGAGTAVAASGLSADGAPVDRQYPGEVVPAGGGTDHTPTKPESTSLGGGTDSGRVAGRSVQHASASAGSAAPSLDEVAATTEDRGGLPFTGYSVIGVVLLGAALLAAGLAMRRGTRAT